MIKYDIYTKEYLGYRKTPPSQGGVRAQTREELAVTQIKKAYPTMQTSFAYKPLPQVDQMDSRRVYRH